MSPDVAAGTVSRCRIELVIGTRPNIVKLGSLFKVLQSSDWCDPTVVFIEQHTHATMADDALEDMAVPESHIRRISLRQTDFGARLGEMTGAYAALLRDSSPHLVVVFGDVDATLAAALAAKRQGIPLAHVEAGLRSHDHGMPEELNRLLVDSISDIFFATSDDAIETLENEGKAPWSGHMVGNLMIDSLVRTVDADWGLSLCKELGLEPREFCIATFHRPSNVDDIDSAEWVLSLLASIASTFRLLLPLHPRTETAFKRFSLWERLVAIPGLVITGPMRYRDFISVLALSRAAITDSGGIQEETTFLGVPCLTIRENTERPITVALGTNQLLSREQATTDIVRLIEARLPGDPPEIPFWDGLASGRIERILKGWWCGQQNKSP